MKTRQIVLIMTDTQRKDMVSCYGNRKMHTPNLDRLAKDGIRFERAYTCSPVCDPARAGIFTGVFPHSCGVWANLLPLGDNIKTLGQRLRDNGILTAYIGKWHLDGSDYFGLGRCPNGWHSDYWYDMRNYLEELSEADRIRSRQTQTNRNPYLSADFLYAHRCSDRAIKFLEEHRQKDFFLVVSYDEPHGPFLCPKLYSEIFVNYRFPKKQNVWDTLENKPEHQKIWAGNRRFVDRNTVEIIRADFFGCNSYVDSEIGRVLEAIDKYAPDSLIIYTSDHGDMLESHCLEGKGPVMYEEITNIPFIVRWRGYTPVGVMCTQLVSHIDIAPTIMDIMGLKIPKLFEGKSLLQTIKNPEIAINNEIFIEFGRYEIDHDGFGGFQPVRCCLDNRYKLVINLLTSDELYDLQEDPSEINNLIESDAHKNIRNRLHDVLLEWMNRTRDPFRGYYWERRPWRTDARKATWEYTGYTRQRENEEYEPRQLDYDTGLEMKEAVRKKKL